MLALIEAQKYLLASPDEASFAFESLGNHVVDQSMLVPDVQGFKLFAVRLLVHLLKDLEEAPIISATTSQSAQYIPDASLMPISSWLVHMYTYAGIFAFPEPESIHAKIFHPFLSDRQMLA